MGKSDDRSSTKTPEINQEINQKLSHANSNGNQVNFSSFVSKSGKLHTQTDKSSNRTSSIDQKSKGKS